ncbi:MAG: LysE family transporter [Bacteroidota bacterium]
MALITGFIIGYILAIPPGPLGLAAIRYGTRHKLGAVVALAAGAGLLDMLYSLAAMWASGGVLSAIIPSEALEGGSASFFRSTQIVIAAGMIIAGAVLLRASKHTDEESRDDTPPAWTNRLRVGTALVPFRVGVCFAVTNIANPTFLPSLVVMSGSIRSAGMIGTTSADVLLFSSGFGVGNALWLVTLGMLVRRYRERFSGRVVARVRSAMGAVLLGVGLFYAIRILSNIA